MTIQNKDRYLASIWDWKPLRPCFKRGIEPTDIDGFVEIGGYFLVLEGKAPNVPLKEGQRRTFEKMQRWNAVIPRLFTMIVLWGDAEAGRIEQLQFWPAPPFPGSWPELTAYIRAWSEWAEGGGTLSPETTTTKTPPIVTAHREVQRADIRKHREESAARMLDERLIDNLEFARGNRNDADCRQWIEILQAEQTRRSCSARSSSSSMRGTT